MIQQVFIGRQPILDTDMKVFAYELQFNHGLNPNEETIEATANLISETDAEIGFKNIVGNHVAMMQLPKDLIKIEGLPNLHSEHPLLLAIPNDVDHDVPLLKNLKALKIEGTGIVLNDYVEDESSERLTSISDFVKVDVSKNTETQLKKILEKLHFKGVKVIADQVETEEMFRYLRKLGFDLFQGYFFTNPVMINGQQLSGNKMTLLQLMAKVNAPETGFEVLSEIIGQDVALTHKLLVAVNNPASMIPIQVESVADALTYMGLKRLKFWVNMLLLSDMDEAPQELMITSLMAARFCEVLAERTGQAQHKDSFFLVGLFSNLGAFFRMPIADILSEMPLGEDIKEALINHIGPMGEALSCLEALEQSQPQPEKMVYQTLTLTEINHIFMSASAWAQQVIQG